MSEDRNKQTQYPSEESSDFSSSEEETDDKSDDNESEASYDEVDEDTDSSDKTTDNEKLPANESSSYSSDDDDDDDDESLIDNGFERREFVRGVIGPHTGYMKKEDMICEGTTKGWQTNYFEIRRNDIRDESVDDDSADDSDDDSDFENKKFTITVDASTNTDVVKRKLTMSKVEIEEFCEIKQEESIVNSDKMLETDDMQGHNNTINLEAVMSQHQSLFYDESTQTDFVHADLLGHKPSPNTESDELVCNITELHISKYAQKNTQTDAFSVDTLNQSSQETQTDRLSLDMKDAPSQETQTDRLSLDMKDAPSQETQTDRLSLDMKDSPSEETQTERLSLDMKDSPSEATQTDTLSLDIKGLPSNKTQTDGLSLDIKDSPSLGTTETDLRSCVPSTQHPALKKSTQPETLLTLIENLVQEEESTDNETKASKEDFESETTSAESIQFDLEKRSSYDKMLKSDVNILDVKTRNERIPINAKKEMNKTERENLKNRTKGNLKDTATDARQKHPILCKKTRKRARFCPACSFLSRDMESIRHVCGSHGFPRGQGTAVSQAQYRMLYHYRWPELSVTKS